MSDTAPIGSWYRPLPLPSEEIDAAKIEFGARREVIVQTPSGRIERVEKAK